MKKLAILFTCISLVAAVSCKKDGDEPDPNAGGGGGGATGLDAGLIDDFEVDITAYPNQKTDTLRVPMGGAAWENGGVFKFNQSIGGRNGVLMYKRIAEWYYQGYPSFNGLLTDAFKGSVIEDLESGATTIKVDIYFEEGSDYDNADGNGGGASFGFTMSDMPTNSIPVVLTLQDGTKNDADYTKGKRSGWVDTITVVSGWQTLEFERYPGDPDVDATVGVGDVDKFTISINPGWWDRTDGNNPVTGATGNGEFDYSRYYLDNLIIE